MIEFENFGDGEKSVLFLHGGGASIKQYDELLNKMSLHYKVIAPNLPGVGKSTRTNSINETVISVNSFINNLPEDKITIVGHSFGGAIADVVSRENPKITKEVLVDCTVFKSPKNVYDLFLRICLKTFNGVFKYKNLRSFNFDAIKFQTVSSIFDTKNFMSHVSQSVENTITPLNLSIKSRVPRLILWGNNDELSPIKDIPKEFLDQIEIVEGNHDWLIGNPNLFMEKVKEFI